MSRNIKELIQEIELVRPETGVVYAGLKRIETRKERTRRIKAGGFTLIAVGSGAGVCLVILDIKARVSTNGFNDFLSLVVTDSPAASEYWKELSLSLAESFPIMSTATLCVLAALLLWSGLKSLGFFMPASRFNIR